MTDSDRLQEKYFCVQNAVRKGRSQAPCILKIGITTDGSQRIVLRGVDQSGTASMVTLLDSDGALALAAGLLQAIDVLNAED